MPATKPNPDKAADKAKANGQISGPRFVRCDLNPAQKEQLVHWSSELEDMDMLKWLWYKVERGHVVSIRYNEVGYQCSVTGTSEGSGHKDQSLVARASTPERAVHGAMFRDQVVLEGNWPLSGLLDDLDF
jgi:hypothetical protein